MPLPLDYGSKVARRRSVFLSRMAIAIATFGVVVGFLTHVLRVNLAESSVVHPAIQGGILHILLLVLAFPGLIAFYGFELGLPGLLAVQFMVYWVLGSLCEWIRRGIAAMSRARTRIGVEEMTAMHQQIQQPKERDQRGRKDDADKL